MRGAARVGGRSFKVPRSKEPTGIDPLNLVVPITELTVSPVLVPITDGWSISNLFSPVDEKDCAAYPASPYCENEILTFTPLGIEPEIKTNGCESCLYLYTAIAFFKLQPLIICKRDPNCGKKYQRNIPSQEPPEIPEIPAGYKLVAVCTRSYEIKEVSPPKFKKFAGEVAKTNANGKDEVKLDANGDPEGYRYISREEWRYNPFDVRYGNLQAKPDSEGLGGGRESVIVTVAFASDTRDNQVQGAKNILSILFKATTGKKNSANEIFNVLSAYNPFPYNLYLSPRVNFAELAEARRDFWKEYNWGIKFRLQALDGSGSYDIDTPIIYPPPPPPPYRDDGENNNRGIDRPDRPDDRKGDKKRPIPKREKDKMCCNDCRDAADRTTTILRDVREIKKALGSGQLDRALNAAVGIGDGSVTGILNLLSKTLGAGLYPIEVPQSLITGVGDNNVLQMPSLTDYIFWLTNQLDALIGEFPIKVEITDIDPLTPGDQKKTVNLPNIAEGMAEIYGLTLKSAVNQEVELNMLLRLAAEVVATKNGVAITQDYARANADFLGYRGNKITRDLTYNFDFASADLINGKAPIVMENILTTVQGKIEGWTNEDKETVTDYLKRLMFSAGIIKAAFFRNKKQSQDIAEGIKEMSKGEKESDEKWNNFVQAIKDPNSDYNKDAIDKPEIYRQTKDPNQL